MSRKQRASFAIAALAAVALVTPTRAHSQQVLHISGARSAIAFTITGRELPDAESLVNSAREKCPIDASALSNATHRVRSALTAAEPRDVPSGLVLITTTTQPNNAECGTSPDDAAKMTAAAIEFRQPDPHSVITGVELADSQGVITPALVRTIRTVPLWARDDEPGKPVIQIAVPLEHFMPERSAETGPLVLMITREDETVERRTLSDADVDALWRLALPARAAAASADSGWAQRIARVQPIAVEDLPEAAALMQQLTDARDTLSDRMLARQLLATEPCLRLPADAPMAATTLIERSRPAAHCRSRRPITTALSGALVPGLGQVSSRWRTVAGIVVLGIVAQRLHASQVSKRDGRDYYQQYVDATSVAEASEYWARADKARRQTDVLIMQAGAIWLGAAVEATWYESRLGKRLRFAAPIARPATSR